MILGKIIRKLWSYEANQDAEQSPVTEEPKPQGDREASLEGWADEESKGLTRKYPVQQTLGSSYDYWRSNGHNFGTRGSFFRNSPAQNTSAENVFGGLVQLSAKQDEWVGYVINGLTPEELEDFHQRRRTQPLNHFEKGMSNALDAGVLRLEVHDGKVYYQPTEGLVNLTQERAERYSQAQD